MAKLLKILLILLPALEIVVLLLVGEEIGVVPTLLALLGGVAVGMAVIRWLGAASLREFQAAVQQGASPLEALKTGAATLAAGVLFIAPGFVTDFLAALLLARAAWIRLRRPPERSPAPEVFRPDDSSGMPGVAKIVDAEFVIIEKEQQPNPKREAP